MVDDFWEKHNKMNARECDIHFISFRRKGTSGYNCLQLGRGEKPKPWHIEKLREVIRKYEAGEYDDTPGDDYSDLC